MPDRILSARYKEVICDVVYNMLTMPEIEKKYGVKYLTLWRALKAWKVVIPSWISSHRSIGWREAKRRLPVPGFLRAINRSEFARCYRNHTQAEVAEMYGVTRSTISKALLYHCIKRRTRREAYEMYENRKEEKHESSSTEERRA